MRAALLCLLALAAGCPGSPQVTTTDLVDEGTACVDGTEVLVDFNHCLSSSCDTLVDEVCTATLDGTTLTVTASATVESVGNECTADCGFAQVRCDLPEGWEAATTLSYGGESQAIDAECAGF
jgi:hypothetical protein